MSLVLTKAALALKSAESNFQSVKFEAHKAKKKITKAEETVENNQNQHTKKNDLDLKKIRHEVVKLGMSGFSGNKKRDAKIALAVSLGAKPPKKHYMNYKQLMEKRVKDKEKEARDKQNMIIKNTVHSFNKTKSKNKNSKNDVGHLLTGYGKIQKKELKQATTGVIKRKK